MLDACTSVILNALLSMAAGFLLLLPALRLLGPRMGLLPQVVVLFLVLLALNLGNAFCWGLPAIQVRGAASWLALLMLWCGWVYFYAIHFATIARDGGPTFLLFRFLEESPSGTRTHEELIVFFQRLDVLDSRMEALVRAQWLERTGTGSYAVTRRGRRILRLFDGWLRLFQYPWGG